MTNEELDALDWEVAKLEGALDTCRAAWTEFHPSRNWAQGGPIIERDHIEIRPTITEGGYRTSSSADAVEARIMLPNGAVEFNPALLISAYGPTALIAAMCCYISQRNLERN